MKPSTPHLTAMSLAVSLLVTGCATQGTAEIAALRAEVKTLQTDMRHVDETVTHIDKLISDRLAADAPKPEPTSITLGDSPLLGDRNAKIGIVEFSDYQCPFCRNFHTKIFPLLRKDYIDAGKVQFFFKDMPLEMHPLAEGAAIAARCAGAQGAYWPMNEALYAKQPQLGPTLYAQLATELKLDTSAFNHCLTDDAPKAEMKKDFAYGNSLGIDGTPTFFIGRIAGNTLVDIKRIVGAQPPQVFAQHIEALLPANTAAATPAAAQQPPVAGH